MKKHPNRKKDKYNPYTLYFDEDKELYFVEFKDGNKITHKVEVSKKVYTAFDKFELDDISQINKIRKHIERNEVYEESLFHRAINIPTSVEDIAKMEILKEELKLVINELHSIQKRRLKKYYFSNMTLKEIAKVENRSKVAIKYSIDIAIKKIYNLDLTFCL